MTQILTNVIAIFIFTMTAAVFAQVLTRYVLHISLPVLQTFIAFSMSWLTMLGSAVALQNRKHFAINLFEGHRPNLFITSISLIREAAVLIVIITLIVNGYRFALMGLVKVDPCSGLREVYTYAAVFGGAIFMLYYFVVSNWPRRNDQ